MGWIQNIKESRTTLDNSEPIFKKEFAEENQQIKDLEEIVSTQTGSIKEKIEKDIKMLRAGVAGEKNVYFELKNSFLPIVCLHDIRIEYKDYVAQLDFVVISPVGIYILECKKLVGDIEVNNQGDFIRHLKNKQGKVIKKEGMYSPITQNERHIEILKQLLINEAKFEVREEMLNNLVIMADPKLIINYKFAPKAIKEKLIRYDQLKKTLKDEIETKKSRIMLSKTTVNKVIDCLLKYDKPVEIDYSSKYKLNEKMEGTIESNTDSVDKESTTKAEGIAEQSNAYEVNKDIDISKVKDVKISTNVEAVKKGTLSQHEQAIYDELKKYRLETSRKENVKPYFLYSNAQLDELVKVKPSNKEELMKIHGFGLVKCEKYGDEIIRICSL